MSYLLCLGVKYMGIMGELPYREQAVGSARPKATTLSHEGGPRLRSGIRFPIIHDSFVPPLTACDATYSVYQRL